MQQYDANGMTADAIAAGLDRDRADLAQRIDGLRGRLSVDALIGDALGYAQANVAPYARMLDSAVRANPVAAVMAGVGLAWLVLGRKGSGSASDVPLAGTKFEALSRWEDEGGPVAPLPDADQAWIYEADRLRDGASAALARIDAAARSRLRPAAEIVADRVKVLADLAKATRAAMLRGLESLGMDAQSRILAVREQAYMARINAVRQGTKLIEQRPLIAGGIGMAIGAAVAAALPRTNTEDRMFGHDRDRLLAGAQDALRQERVRAADVAMRLADTIAATVQDSAQQLVSTRL